MRLWRQYFKEQTSITGYMNYMEDRYRIMTPYKLSIEKCLRKFVNISDSKKRHIEMYKCENSAIEDTISKIRTASEKCENSQFPEKCRDFYNHIVPDLEYKLKFNNSQVDNLSRKAGLIKYD